MIKSKERIADFGEVFTPEKEVNAMLDLVENEIERIDSRFLEPACGDGNFLIQILRRKIYVVEKRYSKEQIDFERNVFLAVSSIYGIDILKDNVQECRERLTEFVETIYKTKFKTEYNPKFINAIRYVISKNILHGDALTLQNISGTAPILFSEWCFVSGSKIKRTEYSLSNMIAYQPFGENSLFSDLGEEAFIPHHTKAYPLTYFMDVEDA